MHKPLLPLKLLLLLAFLDMFQREVSLVDWLFWQLNYLEFHPQISRQLLELA